MTLKITLISKDSNTQSRTPTGWGWIVAVVRHIFLNPELTTKNPKNHNCAQDSIDIEGTTLNSEPSSEI